MYRYTLLVALLIIILLNIPVVANAATDLSKLPDGMPIITNQTEYEIWMTSASADDFICLNPSANNGGDLLQQILENAPEGTKIQLVGDKVYSAPSFMLSTDGVDIIGIKGENDNYPELRITTATEEQGFLITANSTGIMNVTLNGTDIAKRGFRIECANNTYFDNVTVKNFTKTGFDVNRNTNSTYTNIVAIDNGGFGITITQG